MSELERKRFEPGWYKDISNDDYHSSSGTSSSRLKKLVEKTYAHSLYDMHHPKESTESMSIGTLVHCLVLEPDKFDDEYIIIPEDIKAPTSAQLNAKNPSDKSIQQMEDYSAWLRKAEDKIMISQSQFDQASTMAQNVLLHPTASALLASMITESSVFWWYKSQDPDDPIKYQEMLKVRPDAIDLNHGVLLDLKTTTDASYDGFIRSIQKYYYHLSAAMYLDGVNQCQELKDETGFFFYSKFVFICVESAPPHLCSVYELSREYLELGRLLYRRAMKKLHESKQEGSEKGFPLELRVIEPPPFAKRLFIV